MAADARSLRWRSIDGPASVPRPRETPPTLAERIRRGLDVGATVGAVYALFGLALRAFPTSPGYGWSPSFEEAFVEETLMRLKIMNLYVEPPSL